MKLGTILVAISMLAMGAFGCGGSDEGATETGDTTDEQAVGGEETAPMDAPVDDAAANPCAGGTENPCAAPTE